MISRIQSSSNLTLRRILCPTRFSSADAEVLGLASALARDCDAELFVVHAAEARRLYCDNAYRERIERSLEGVRSACRSVELSTMLVTGQPASAIVGICRDLHCDLLVMRASARGWIEGRWVESLSQRVQRLAPCPVVTISNGVCSHAVVRGESSTARARERDPARALAGLRDSVPETGWLLQGKTPSF